MAKGSVYLLGDIALPEPTGPQLTAGIGLIRCHRADSFTNFKVSPNSQVAKLIGIHLGYRVTYNFKQRVVVGYSHFIFLHLLPWCADTSHYIRVA